MKIIGKIPNDVFLAFSGGGDSCAALAFLLNGRKRVHLLHFHHGTEHSEEAFRYTLRVAEELDLPVSVGDIAGFREKLSGESQEEYWRNARYDFFSKYHVPIVMAHHLNDCIETWLFGALHGTPKTIPYRRHNCGDYHIIRPFLPATREELIGFLLRKGDPILHEWVGDPSNEDTKYMRNLIRHEMMPIALKVNPGLAKVIRREVMRAAKGMV